jgi:hypothetical protein
MVFDPYFPKYVERSHEAKANKWINPDGHKIDEAGMNFKYITRRMK